MLDGKKQNSKKRGRPPTGNTKQRETKNRKLASQPDQMQAAIDSALNPPSVPLGAKQARKISKKVAKCKYRIFG